MRILLSVFLIIFLCFTSKAQRYSFLNYNTAQGLPQSQVTSLTQDSDGYLWVGTLGGLARFNGKDFYTYSTENGLLNNRVRTIKFIDKDLWVGHDGGVSLLRNSVIKKWSFSKEFKTTNVSKIIRFNDRIIVASNGAGLYEIINDKLVKIPLLEEDDLSIRDLIVHNGKLLIGTRGGILHTTDLKNFQRIKRIDGYSVSNMKVQKNDLYVTTFMDGLLKVSLTENTLERIKSIDSTLTLRNCLFDSKGNLWVNSTDGIYRLKNEITTLKLNLSNGLPMESIRSVFEDDQGNIWLGSEGKGLFRFPGEKFVYYNEATGLISDLILNVNQDHKGDYWIGTYDKGLMKMSKNKTVIPISLENNNTVWSSVIGVDGLNWFGTGFGLVAMNDTKLSKVYYSEDKLPGDKITAMHKLSSTSFYVGGSEGVSLYKNGVFSLLKSGDIGTVRDFCKVGDILYCATDKGLFKLKGMEITNTFDFNKTIFSLAVDGANTLWIGSDEGLFKLKKDKIEQVSFSTVTSSNFINFLNYDNHKLFIGTNNGLFVLSNLDKDKLVVTNFGLAEGVVNLETNLNSSFIDKKGRLWFGTASGLVSYLPSESDEQFSSPRLILKNILINYQNIDFSKYANGLDEKSLPIDLRLPYSKNNLTFEMDGISLSNFPGMKFQFWLEGQDETWSPLHNNTTITFSGLSAGDYVLHARSVDSRGSVSEEISFSFTVKQAFYWTWWFITLVILLVAYLIFRIFRFRLNREREENEKEKMGFKSRLLALEQKSLNASMNRHFIFNSLNSIQYFINTQDRLSANKFLTNFAKLIRKNLDSSEDGNEVALSQELERLDLYLSLESMRFKDRFEYKINCAKEIDTESVIIPAMMLQPFIENSIIHGILPDESKKGMINIDISLDGDILTIQIEDNGVGVETSINSKLNYDGDHRSQGMEITTKRIELLRKLTNRYFELIGPTQIRNNDRSIKGTMVTLKFQVENLEN